MPSSCIFRSMEMSAAASISNGAAVLSAILTAETVESRKEPADHSFGEWPLPTAGPGRRSAADREVHPLSGPDGACRNQRLFSRSSGTGFGRELQGDITRP